MRTRINRFFLSLFFIGFCLFAPFHLSFAADYTGEGEGKEQYAELSPQQETLPADDDDTLPETGEGTAGADHAVTDTDDFDADEDWYGANDLPAVADPIQPFNRAMYHFNDKMYFWVLKPVATGYNVVVPEPVRVGVKNFFTNLAFPVRFTSSLLQGDFKGVARETGRFTLNTIWGLAGFLDPASLSGDFFARDDADLGETFGVWGIGQGMYIVWPVLGPSSLRDTFAAVGEYFLSPVTYLRPWYVPTGVRSYQSVNDTSLRLGDYEAFVGAAIDPYISMRDAYTQHRTKKIENKRKKLYSPAPKVIESE